jgi:hypothetical protein
MPNTSLVTVNTCQQSRTRRAATGSIVETSQSDTILGQLIQVWCRNFTSVTTQISITEVISQDNDDVWFFLGEGDVG